MLSHSQQQQQQRGGYSHGDDDLTSSTASSPTITVRSDRDREHFYGSSDEVKFSVPLPKVLLRYPMVARVWNAMIPKFPDSIKDRIHVSTLVFHSKQEPININLPSLTNSRSNLTTTVHTSTTNHSSSSSSINDQDNDVQVITEGDYERYNNLISHRRIRIIILVAILMQVMMSVLNYIKYGNYVFRRDVIMTAQLVITVLCSAILFRFPLSSSRVTVLYLQFILLCNPIQRLIWADTFSPYEPSYQIMLWINFATPTAKFWHASVTGFVGILCVIVIRILQHYDTVFKILWLQLCTYMLYHIVVGFGQRLTEVINRSLYVELLHLCPRKPAHLTYAAVERFCNTRSHWLTQRFKQPQLEQRFLAFYGAESIVEVGLLLSTVVSSAYYIFQDMYYSKPGMLIMFIVLRFALVIPGFVLLFYLSILRRSRPILADLISLAVLALSILAQFAMFYEVVSWEGSLFYFGAMMRVLTLASNQLFLLHTLYLIPISYAIIPLAILLYGSQSNNYIFFFVVLTVVVVVFTLLREKNQRLRFLVQHYGHAILDPDNADIDINIGNYDKEPTIIHLEVDGNDYLSPQPSPSVHQIDDIEMSILNERAVRDHSIAINSQLQQEQTAHEESSGSTAMPPATKSPARRNLLDYSQDSFNV